MLARDASGGAQAYGAAVSEFIANSTVSAFVTVLVLGSMMWTLDMGRPLTILAQVLVAVSLVYVVVAAIALAGRVYLIGMMIRGLGSLPMIGSRLRVDPAQVRRMEDAILHVLRDRPAILLQILVLEAAAQAILIAESYWALTSMNLPVTVGGALLIEALTKMANIIQFVGVTEGGYALVFDWLGMTATVGFTLSLVKRVRSMAVAAVGLGLLTRLDRWSSSRAL
jgi:hypothetical protein